MPKSRLRAKNIQLTALDALDFATWRDTILETVTDVRHPKLARPRDRMVTDHDLEALSISGRADLTKATARVLFAIETVMRSGRLLGLRSDNLDIDNWMAHLPGTKP
jgi:integrase